MKAERVVCDTNVLISAAIVRTGNPRRVLVYVRASAKLLMCETLKSELVSRLARPKFDRYLSNIERQAFHDDLSFVTEIVTIEGTLKRCRDPDDDVLLETAIIGKADCLVTGDNDILVLRPCGDKTSAVQLSDAVVEGVAILRPAEFLRFLSES